MDTIYDVIIIGGGPAGCAAAVYSARKRLKTLLITESFGGQSVVSDDIQNWIGDTHISGFELAQRFEAHVRSFGDIVEIQMPERVKSVQSISCDAQTRICDFAVETESGKNFKGKTVIVVAGARRRRLGIPGEAKFEGKGVVFCSTCDAPLFGGKTVAVVGGGNAGLEAVVDLFSYAKKIYLLVRGDTLKGDEVTQETIKNPPAGAPSVEIIFNAESKEVGGDGFVTGLRYRDIKSDSEKTIAVEGVFVEIGSVPNSEIVKGLVEIDQWGQIVIDSKHGSTSHPGIYAAGDITNDPYKQNNISAGDAVKAALAAYNYLLRRQKQPPASA